MKNPQELRVTPEIMPFLTSKTGKTSRQQNKSFILSIT